MRQRRPVWRLTAAQLGAALGYLDANAAAIRITGGLALVLGFVQYGEAIRLGFRDRTHAIPLLAVLFQLANDVSYTLHYARWFHVVRHPFFTTQWVLIAPFVVLELVVLWQLMTYSRHEVFPGLARWQAWAALLALAAAMLAAHWYFATTSDDFLGQKTNMLTLICSNLGIYLLVRRGGARGQSMLLATAVVLCAGVPQFFVHFPAMGPAFRTPAFYALGTVVCGTGLLYACLLGRVMFRGGGAPADGHE